MNITFTAAIGTAADVAGDYCDVMVGENEILTYKRDDEGNETPVYAMSGRLALDAVKTDVRTDDDDALNKVEASAEDILGKNGWIVTGPWEVSDNALYAPVERA